ncbi:MAG TPA: NAD(P)H:quinone oxidoreductase, partial [Acetobacteraceae bacterium]|nr:NAD(P)H:quinone oxidoreductase [Acetobacteraceae bacterium]
MAPKVLIAFYSRTGSVEALAKQVGAGAKAAGAEVRLRRAREVVGPEVMAKAPGWAENAQRMNALYEAPTEADAEWADAIIFGTPTRFGAVSSELKAYIDGLGGLWFQGKLTGKAGAAFTSTSSLHGGNESTIISLYNPMAHLGLIIVPLGYVDPAVFKAGTPYGASA